MINTPLSAKALRRLSRNLRAGSLRAKRQGNLELAARKYSLAVKYERRLVNLVVR